MAKSNTLDAHCFVVLPYPQERDDLRDLIKRAAHDAGFRTTSIYEMPARTDSPLVELIATELSRAKCLIADLSQENTNILVEVGIAYALGKGLILLHQQELRRSPFLVPQLTGSSLLRYRATAQGYASLEKRLRSHLFDNRVSGNWDRRFRGLTAIPSFTIDWTKITPRDFENMCFELLEQMGYQRVEWLTKSSYFDIAAELPKKDPDGFDYNERWLISFENKAPADLILKRAALGADYLYQMHFEESPFKLPHRDVDALMPLTLLIIPWQSFAEGDPRWEHLLKRMSDARSSSVRVRVWDRAYLASLIRQFPHIGFKYFSDEARAQSKYRKTPEELYKENQALSNRQARLIAELEQEKNLRARAERDAAWKDISFSAAHKIGNPIFAIETNLDPLRKRVRESRIEEQLEVVEDIGRSVEKAKAIIEQFKSLAQSQAMKREPVELCPLIKDSCKISKSSGISCKITCPSGITVLGDAERLAECFDELLTNATHWMDKEKRLVEVVATTPAIAPLPLGLDNQKIYALIVVKDNGAGVKPEDKSRIFDAFVTKDPHGTGLGLALVRHIIEGHGGVILECGEPGQGAEFRLYLPQPSENEPANSLLSESPPTRKRKRKANATDIASNPHR